MGFKTIVRRETTGKRLKEKDIAFLFEREPNGDTAAEKLALKDERAAAVVASMADVQTRMLIEGRLQTPLAFAIRSSLCVTVHTLLSSGADAKATENNNWTMAHIAACKCLKKKDGSFRVLQMLKEHGASMEILSAHGATPSDIMGLSNSRS